MCLDHRKASLPPPLLSRRAAPSKVARWQNLISSFPWIALGWRAQSKERKGSNFAAQHGGAIVQKPEGPNTYDPKIWLQPSGNHGVEGGRPSLFPLQFLSKVRGERTTTAAAARWSAARRQGRRRSSVRAPAYLPGSNRCNEKPGRMEAKLREV